MKTFEELGRIGRIMGLLGAFGLAGCASQHANVQFVPAPTAASVASAPAPKVEEAATVPTTSSDEAKPEPAALSIGPLSAANIAMLDSERDVDLEVGFQLAQHVPAPLPFHCLVGEELLGCAATPAADHPADAQPEPAEDPIVVARNTQEGEVR